MLIMFKLNGLAISRYIKSELTIEDTLTFYPTINHSLFDLGRGHATNEQKCKKCGIQRSCTYSKGARSS